MPWRRTMDNTAVVRDGAGMTDSEQPRSFTPAEFDFAHEAEARGTVTTRLAAEAYGREYPSDVQPYGGDHQVGARPARVRDQARPR